MWQQLLVLKLGHQKMQPRDGFSKLSKLDSCLVFATERENEFFKLSYINLFKNILGYLGPLAFFLAFCYTVRTAPFIT